MMEIKVNKVHEESIKLNKISKTDNSFKSILREKKEKKDLLTKDELSEIYDKSTNIKVFGSILKIDIAGQLGAESITALVVLYMV